MTGEKLVKVKELPGRGRGLVTAKEVHGGQVILQESPSLLYVAAAGAHIYCGTCLRTCPSPTTPCPGCRAVTFCSSACSFRHSAHLCSALKCLEAVVFDGDRADQARFLLAAYHVALNKRSEFDLLMLLEGVGLVNGAARKLHAFVEDAVRDWPWSSGQKSVVSVEVTAGLLAKDARNTFGHMAPFVAGEERSVRGFGVYQNASFINHDCLPNSCRFDYLDSPGDINTDIYIRALHAIPENWEVTISYFPINWPFKDRVDRLVEEYGFLCGCKRCNLEECWSASVSEGEDEETDELTPSETAGLNDRPANGIFASGTGAEAGEREQEAAGEEEKGDVAFEHALFFVKYLCPIDGCGGTMAPLASPSPPADPAGSTMECNMCGHLRTGDELHRDVADVWETGDEDG